MEINLKLYIYIYYIYYFKFVQYFKLLFIHFYHSNMGKFYFYTLLDTTFQLYHKSKDIFRNTTFISEQKIIIPLPYLLLHHRFLSLFPSPRRLSLTVESPSSLSPSSVSLSPSSSGVSLSP